MSKVRDLPEITVLEDNDLFYVVDESAGPNGGRKIKKSNLSATPENHAMSHLPGGSDGLATAAPVVVNANGTNDPGVAAAFSRSDHKHNVATGAAVGQAPAQTNAEGVSPNLARADHVHNIPVAAPGTVNADGNNTEGAAGTFSRSDHKHNVAVAAPVTQNADQSNAAGSSSNLARADHVHNIPTAAPVNTGVANSQGSAGTFAKSDHVHNTIIANTAVTATADDTTASPTDVLIVGMSITPAAGTYLATFSTSGLNSGNGASRMFFSIYSGGVQVAHSERELGISGGANIAVHTNAVVTVNGSQAIEAMWRAVAGTNTAHERSLTLIRLG